MRLRFDRDAPALPTVLLPFVLFCGYALLRWQTLLQPDSRPRFFGLLLLAAAVAACSTRVVTVEPGPKPHSTLQRLSLAIAIGLLALIVLLLLSGSPLTWILHLRLAVIVRSLGSGITALPALKVPYIGHARATAIVLVLGAGLLVVAAALVLDGAGPAREAGGRAQRQLVFAAGVLLFAAMVPSVVRPVRFSGLHGAVSCALAMLLIGGWRITRDRVVGALALLAFAGFGGAVISGVVQSGDGLLSVTGFVTSLSESRLYSFNWNQTYGPLGPRGTRVVLTVNARRPAYWKTEDLDEFDGTGWTLADPGTLQGVPNPTLEGVSSQSKRRWTQTIRVTDVGMRSAQLVAAGAAEQPLGREGVMVTPGAGRGTWNLVNDLRPGDSYRVVVYTPKPSARELLAAGARYPLVIESEELQIVLHPATVNGNAPTVGFGSYRPGGGAVYPSEQALQASDLGPVYRIARRLLAGTRTPYGYVVRVERYLQDGFRYVLDPPRERSPITAFLTRTHRGYCQQFAGAMALLLRMGGVPARVAVGFESGSYNAQDRNYTVTAGQAHAWVEVWFAGYGWVTFDPTPAAAQAAVDAGAESPQSLNPGQGRPTGTSKAGKTAAGHHGDSGAKSAARSRAALGKRRAASSPLGAVAVVLLVLLVFVAATWLLRRRIGRWAARPDSAPDAQVRELESAFRRCGRELQPGMTLIEVELALRGSSPAAAAYVRSVRMSRYAADPTRLPDSVGRRALRRSLAAGRAPIWRLRAWLALPPSLLH